jgi:TPR repeat protein
MEWRVYFFSLQVQGEIMEESRKKPLRSWAIGVILVALLLALAPIAYFFIQSSSTGDPQKDYEFYLNNRFYFLKSFKELKSDLLNKHSDKLGTITKFYSERLRRRKAMNCLKRAANKGHAEAQFALAMLYDWGEMGLDKDIKKSNEWLVKSADNGSPRGMNLMGVKYLSGKNFPKDKKKAFELFLEAAKKGHADSKFDICLMYYNGDYVEKDKKKAFEWAMKAANKNYAQAINYLGESYKFGWGVEKDYKKAFECFKKADYFKARYNLALMYYNGQGCKKNLKKAFELTEKASCILTPARNFLGFLYLRGYGTNKDNKKAFELFYESATSDNDSYGQLYLAEMYYKGLGCQKDYKEALKWCNKAVKNGNISAKFFLAYMYQEGKAMPKDLDKAEELYRDIIVTNPANGKNSLAYMFAEEGIKLDEAEKLAKEALKLVPDEPNTIDTLGWVYYKQKKYKEAVEELSKAVKLVPSAVSRDHLGDALLALGEKEKAREEWKKALKLCEENDEELKKEIEAKLKIN